MEEENSEVHLTKLESIFALGIIGCMLFATWELGHLMTDVWLHDWVNLNEFVNLRIILYGIASVMSISSIIITTKFAFRFGRFGRTINRAFLWYGTLLLLSTIAIFVFDCLPEVFAGFIGAGVFAFAIYILQKKYFTKERIIRNRLEKGKCFSCGANLASDSYYCSKCGRQVGRKCAECSSFTKLKDKYCASCGKALKG
jgi:predicted RNA-binding Zn-ribbon protein involved in translation (DUF1610 family)